MLCLSEKFHFQYDYIYFFKNDNMLGLLHMFRPCTDTRGFPSVMLDLRSWEPKKLSRLFATELLKIPIKHYRTLIRCSMVEYDVYEFFKDSNMRFTVQKNLATALQGALTVEA